MTTDGPKPHRWFRYVRIEDIGLYEARGWRWNRPDDPLHAPHGCYAVLMEYEGDGEPEPVRAPEQTGIA